MTWRLIGLATALALIVGCSDGADTQTGAAASEADAGEVEASEVEANQVSERTVNVTLTEGTNMAVAVDGVSGDRVISLQGTLFLLPADGGEAVALTDAYYDAREPQFSPDGSQVVFQGYRNGNWDIWQVGRDGAAPKAITSDPFDDREPQFNADGTSVVFSSDRSGSYDVWRIELASGELGQMTHHDANAFSPSLASDGRLAYTQAASGRAQIMLQVSAEGGAPQDSVVVVEAGRVAGVQFSPDGSQISYQVLGAGGAQLKVADIATKVASAVSATGADVFPFKAAWLDDQTVAYTADGLVVKRSLQDGQAQANPREEWPFSVQVTLTRHDYARRQRDYDASVERQALGLNSPQISNDGAHIYFSALGDVWHWQPGSDTLAKLTDDALAETSLALSPDGKTLAYAVERGKLLHLALMNLADGQVQEADVAAAQLSLLSWSAQGDKLGFFVDVPGNPLGGQLMLMDVQSGATSKVLTPMPAQPVSFSANGERVAISRLNPHSSRFREGVYELVVAEIASGETQVIAPDAHRSLLDGRLTADDAMVYVQGGLLHRLELDDEFSALESAGPLTNELTDSPGFSANGEYLVYLSGQRLVRKHLASGDSSDITPTLTYKLDRPSERYVLRGGRIFTGEGNAYVQGHDIWVNGDRIEKIVPASEADAADEATVIDVQGKTLLPGLFEMHAHMGQTSETQGRVWLSYGITTVRDPGSNPYLAKARQETWDSGRSKGPRTHITGYLTDGNRVYYAMAEGIVSDEHLQMSLDRTAQLELDFIKTYVRLPDHWQKTVVDYAHGIGIPVSSHELYPAIAHGMDHVEHIGGTSRRGYQPKVSSLGYSYGDVISLLTEGGMGMTATAVLPGFAVILSEEPDWYDNAQFDHFYGAQVREGYKILMRRFGGGATGIAKANGRLLKALSDADALLVTGTDSPFVPYGAGLHAEFRLYARAGIEPANIIRQATINSARAAGVDGELGSLEEGKLADIVVVDGDPLANIGDLDNVVMTVKNGRRHTLESLLVD